MYDLVVIGSGPGGHAAALGAARLGAKALVIERDTWGGTCTNRGCIPTKALLACSRQYAGLFGLKRLGIAAEGSFDFSAMKRHQAQMVRTASLGAEKSLKDAGVELRQGEAHLASPGEVELASGGARETIKAKNIVIAWGGKPQVPDVITLSERVMTSDGFLGLASLPSSAAIIGGGVIGLEFAAFLSQLGAKVTVIEFLDRILATEETEVSAFLARELGKSGVDILCPARVESVSPGRDSVVVKAVRSGEVIEINAEIAIVCTGRKPALNIDELQAAGIAFDRKGILIDSNMMTNVKGIYAVGDVTGGAMLAHRAAWQGKSLASGLFGDGSMKYSDAAVPYVCYTSPNVARVGMTQTEAAEIFPDLEVISLEYGPNMYARVELKAAGFGKLLFGSGRLVGATLAGHDSAELIAPLGLAVACGLGKADFKKWIVAHPTLSEILNPF